MTDTRTLVLIPARMAATRLPGKPLLDIAGLPMIVHVLRRAEAANIGRVAVATDTPDIAAAVRSHGGEAVMTSADHPSGSDRIFEALGKLDPSGHDRNRHQSAGRFSDHPAGQYPRRAGAARRSRGRYRHAGGGNPHRGGKQQPQRCEGDRLAVSERRLRALYFSRAAAPWGDGPRYHHVGLYAYRRKALERFVALPPSPLELQEKLEQLRALEAGMRIDVTIVDTVPRGVDTPADLETTRQILAKT